METLRRQYMQVKKETKTSHVEHYGNLVRYLVMAQVYFVFLVHGLGQRVTIYGLQIS